MRCNCKHLGQCPFHEHHLRMTYPDGTPMFRELLDGEDATIKLGDAVGTWTPTDPEAAAASEPIVITVARAIDPARMAIYAQAKRGRQCSANYPGWAMTHPIPANSDGQT